MYKLACSKNELSKDKIVFADMHTDGIPQSMQAVYKELKRRGYRPKVMCKDTAKMGPVGFLRFMNLFMNEYASAGTVVISTYFLPVSSAKKRRETKVVQLWHSGGLLKKMGYDTGDDIPRNYRGKVAANYDLVTVSAPICEKVWESALHLEDGSAKAMGISRTDIYFDENWNQRNKDIFFSLVPEAKGKKVVLYAPSFSGNAAMPKCFGLEMMTDKQLSKILGDDYYVIFRPHPLMQKKYPEYFNGKLERFTTSRLLSLTDLLITDYSSILFDYSIYRKPFVLFCPDFEEYKKNRGFYADPDKFPCFLTKNMDQLVDAVHKECHNNSSDNGFTRKRKEELEEFYNKYMGACDGHSTHRVVDYIVDHIESL
ncbi:MAG: CDP-glycerol glycerophosphotransferase family protein [Eubacterium sp.]|nr:CDP-glycerol glycerophosphotransferase family protein [Eubacterium sp.]